MNKAKIQNAISFVKFNVVKCEFNAPFHISQEELSDISVDLKFSTGFNDSDKNNFAVRFIVNIESISNKDFNIYIYVHCVFQTKDTISEEFKCSDFAKMNAPAIAFPFLRSFVQTLCVNAGIPPIILPSFNFTNIIESNKGEDLE